MPREHQPDDGFEQLRAKFFQRLKDEKQRLLDLSAALAQGKMDRVPVLDELRSRAHGLSGTASILDLQGVAALARALEVAVEGMAADRALATLQALIQVVDSLDTPSREPRPQERVVTSRGARPHANIE
jgi:chemotaxis protein histidine kinase CheA